MAVQDFNAQRLFVDADLMAGGGTECNSDQAHYLMNVLRLKRGDAIRVFNGRDGEWFCRIASVGKRRCVLEVLEQTRSQETGPDIGYFFAPLKRARLDYMVQKATEIGVARIQPVLTQHTIADRVNTTRMRANVIEAAEQCGILRLPLVGEPVKFAALLDAYPADRALIVCDEAAPVASALEALARVDTSACDILIGPEGGFTERERAQLLRQARVFPISLGPRIMRADTAAVAALAILNSVKGDWR